MRKNRRAAAAAFTIILVAAAIGLAVWRPWRSPSGEGSPTGVSIEVHGVGSINSVPDASEFAAYGADGRNVTLRDGHIFVDGRDGGPAKAVDAVVLDQDGRLFVNGQEQPVK